MNVEGARILVPGATGAIGAALAGRLHGRGARVAVAGRDPVALQRVAEACGGAPAFRFDAYGLDRCAHTVTRAAERLGGLDAVVVLVGVPAFGPAPAVDDTVAEHLFTVNALAPMAFLRAALPVVPPRGVLAAVTGPVVDVVPAGMADYGAAKAALAAWLAAVRRERRRVGPAVLDIRLPHTESGFARRAVVGDPPRLPPGRTVDEAADEIVEALVSSGTAGHA
ncbi:SDR family NAD(P)-dependent oxidoreductase [Streptomyces actuosus]|uniref:SDR family NAD(P)-dependent oxidoreductase n=1 Tax=Streptomyces actuosus TaxID=1885 RepID=A0ABS2VUQ3_STRAS|nr:SDR family NAD(P)-dependent oxidoreductase [Streptomyces actuosus]MBN0046759.1 SDR family NAD(P)-dependent oxidoreductase [Streptomyces actuosus]